jgi:DNA-binding NarL/FixJ family response regulator
MRTYVSTIIVDPSTLFREGLARILSGTRFRVAAACSNLDELPKNLAINGRECLLLMGVGEYLPADFSQVFKFKQQHDQARIIVLGEQCKSEELLTAVEAGADGYLTKHITTDALLKSLELVLVGETILPARFLRMMRGGNGEEPKAQPAGAAADPTPEPAAEPAAADVVGAEHFQRLSTREQLIMRCLTRGASNKTVARELNIAEATVKVHIKAILRKLRVKNRTQAAIWAVNGGAAPYPAKSS